MAWFFLSRVAAALTALITLLVLTRLLTPEDFGRYNMIVASGTICQQIFFAWIVNALTRFYNSEEFGGRALSVSMGSSFVAVAFMLPIAFFGWFFIPPPLDSFFLLTAAFALSTALHELVLAALRVENRGPPFAIATLLRPIVATSLAAGLVLTGGSYGSAIWANVAGAMLAVAFGLPKILKLAPVKLPDVSILRSFFAFGQPLSFVRSASMLLAFSTQLILAAVVSLAQVGFFSAAMALSQRSITMLMVTLGQTTAVDIFSALETEGEASAARQLHKHFSLLLLTSAPLLAVLVFANDTVASIIFNDTFGPGVAPHLAILSVAAFINGIQASFLAFSFSMKRETLKQLVLTIGIAVMHVVITYFVTRSYGAIGASWATLGMAVFNASIYTLYGWRLVRASEPLGPLLKIAAALAASAPFLLAADHLQSTFQAIGLAAIGMLAFLAALKLLRYESLDTVLAAAWGIIGKYVLRSAR